MRTLATHTQSILGPLMLQHLADLVSPGAEWPAEPRGSRQSGKSKTLQRSSRVRGGRRSATGEA